MGTPDFAVPSLQALIDAGHEVCAVVTKPDTMKGRSGKLTPSPVKALALQYGIPALAPEKKLNDSFAEALAAYKPDVIVVIAYGKIIPESILNLAPFGCINVHASLLPAYRGAAPIQWAVLNGEEKSGVTIMKVGEGLDTGDIYAQEELYLTPEETAETLFDRLAALGASLLVKTLPEIAAGELAPVPQPEESPTDYARMIVKSDGLIDWTRPAEELERHVRGMNSWPCAFTYLKGKTFKIWESEVELKESGFAPGTVITEDKKGLFVQTGQKMLKVKTIQAEGKKKMPAEEFLRGARLQTGDRFENA